MRCGEGNFLIANRFRNNCVVYGISQNSFGFVSEGIKTIVSLSVYNSMNMIKRVLCFLVLLFHTFVNYGEDSPRRSKPRLVVGITVDNFYPEWIKLYEDLLSDKGLKRLVGNSVKIEADYGYLYSQSGCDQATIYTGTLPSTHGIVAHKWYNRLKKSREELLVSYKYYEIGEGSSTHSPVPGELHSMTLGGFMKMFYPGAKVFSVGIKGENAVLSGGHSADMAFWLSAKSGKWVTSNYYSVQLPDWLERYNAKFAGDNYRDKNWTPLVGKAFNHKMESSCEGLLTTPYANTVVNNMAMSLIDNERLGKDDTPDLLAVNFSCLDLKNSEYPIDSEEFKDVVLRLDHDVEALIAKLDRSVGAGNYILFLTFAEAREFLPVDFDSKRMNADNFSIFRAISLLKSYLNLKYGSYEWIADYDMGQIYLDHELIKAHKISLNEIRQEVVDFLVKFEGISGAWSASVLTGASGVKTSAQASFSQTKSGDILYYPHPYWTIDCRENGLSEGLRYSKRHRVPLYLYGKSGMKCRRYGNMIDLLPTLCDILEIPTPYFCEGKTLICD